MIIHDFENRYNICLVDPFYKLAKELHSEGYNEQDIEESIQSIRHDDHDLRHTHKLKLFIKAIRTKDIDEVG